MAHSLFQNANLAFDIWFIVSRGEFLIARLAQFNYLCGYIKRAKMSIMRAHASSTDNNQLSKRRAAAVAATTKKRMKMKMIL